MRLGLLLSYLLAWSNFCKATGDQLPATSNAAVVPICTLGAKHFDGFSSAHNWGSACTVPSALALSFAVTVKREPNSDFMDFLMIEEAPDTNVIRLSFASDFSIEFSHEKSGSVETFTIPFSTTAVGERKRFLVKIGYPLTTSIEIYVQSVNVYSGSLNQPLSAVNRYVQYTEDFWTGAVTDFYLWNSGEVAWASTARIRTPLCELAGSPSFTAQTSQTLACPSFGTDEFSFAFSIQRLGGTPSSAPLLRFNPTGSSTDFIEVAQATDTQILLSGSVSASAWSHAIDTNFGYAEKRFLVSIDHTKLLVLVDGSTAVDIAFPGSDVPEYTDRSVIIGPATSSWEGGVQNVMVWPFFEVSWEQATVTSASSTTSSSSSSSSATSTMTTTRTEERPFYVAGGSYDTSVAHTVISAADLPTVGNPPGFSIAFTLQVASQSSSLVYFLQMPQPCCTWEICVTSQPGSVQLRWKVPAGNEFSVTLDANFPYGVRKQFLVTMHSTGVKGWTDGVQTLDQAYSTGNVDVATVSRSLWLGVRTDDPAVSWVGDLTDVHLWRTAVSSWEEAQLPTSTATTSSTTSTTPDPNYHYYHPGGTYTFGAAHTVISQSDVPAVGQPPGFSIAFTFQVSSHSSGLIYFVQLVNSGSWEIALTTGADQASQGSNIQLRWKVQSGPEVGIDLLDNGATVPFGVRKEFLVILQSTGVTVWDDGALTIQKNDFTTEQLDIATRSRELWLGVSTTTTVTFVADVTDVYLWPRAVLSWEDAQLPTSTSTTSTSTTSVTTNSYYYNPGGHYDHTMDKLTVSSDLVPTLGNPPGFSFAFTLKLDTQTAQALNFFQLQDSAGGQHVWVQSGSSGFVNLVWMVPAGSSTMTLLANMPQDTPVNFLVIIHSTGVSVWVDGALSVEQAFDTAQAQAATTPRALVLGVGIQSGTWVGDLTDVYLWPKVVSSWEEAQLPTMTSTTSSTMSMTTTTSVTLAGSYYNPGGHYDNTMERLIINSGLLPVLSNPPGLSVAFTLKLDTQTANNWATFLQLKEGNTGTRHLWFQSASAGKVLMVWEVPVPVGTRYNLSLHDNFPYSVPTQFLVIIQSTGISVWVDGVLTGEQGFTAEQLDVFATPRKLVFGTGVLAETWAGDITDVYVWPRAVSSWADAQLPFVSSTTSSSSSSVTSGNTPDCEFPDATLGFGSVFIHDTCQVVLSGALTMSFNIRVDGAGQAIAATIYVYGQADEILLYVNHGGVVGNWQLERAGSVSVESLQLAGFELGREYSILFSFAEDGSMSFWRDCALLAVGPASTALPAAQRAIGIGRGASSDTSNIMTGSMTNIKLWNSLQVPANVAPCPTTTSSTSTTSTALGTLTHTLVPVPAGITQPDCHFAGGEITDTAFFDYTNECPVAWSGAFTIILSVRSDVTFSVNALTLFAVSGGAPVNVIALAVNQPTVGTWTFGSHNEVIQMTGFTTGVEYLMQLQIGEDGSMTAWRNGILVGSGGGAGGVIVAGSRTFYLGRGQTAPNMVGAVKNIMVWNSAPCDIPQNICPTTSTTSSLTSTSATAVYWSATRPDCYFAGGDVSGKPFDYTNDCPVVWSGAFTIGFDVQVFSSTVAYVFTLYVDGSTPTKVMRAEVTSASTWRFLSWQGAVGSENWVSIDGFATSTAYRILFSIGADGTMRIWRDGVLVATGGSPSAVVTPSARTIQMGGRDWAVGDASIQGSITNIHLWNSVPCDVVQDMCQLPSSTTSSSTSSLTSTTTSTSWLTTKPDCSFAGGVVSGTPFDYTNDCPVIFSGAFTIGFDIQVTSTVSGLVYSLFTPSNVESDEIFMFTSSEGVWHFGSGQTTPVAVDGFSTAAEYKIVFSISEDGTMRVWRDGVLAATGTTKGKIVTPTARTIHIGGRNANAGDISMVGSITNIKLWNSAPCDVVEDMCQGPSSTTSSSTSSLTGTTTSTSWLITKPDCFFAGGDVSGTPFDYTNDCPVIFSGAFTIGFNLQVTSTYRAIIYSLFTPSNVVEDEIWMSTPSEGLWRFGSGLSLYMQINGFSKAAEYEILFSISEDGTMRVWRDGVLAATGTTKGKIVTPTARTIHIGGRNALADDPSMIGSIRNIKLWNSAPCDVAENMCQTTFTTTSSSSSISTTSTRTATVTATTSTSSTTSWSTTSSTSSSSSSTTSSVSLTTSATATATSTVTHTGTSSTTSSSTTSSSTTSSSLTSSSTTGTATTSTTTTSNSATSTSTTNTSSVTSTSTTSSITSTRTSTATTTDTVTTVPGLTTTTPSAADLAEAAVGAAVSNILAQGLADGETATVETPLGTVQVFSLGALGNGTSAVATEGGSKVAASAALVEALPAGAVLSLLGFSGGGGSNGTDPGPDPFEGASGGNLASPSLDISVCTPSGCISVTLVEPLIFRLPDPPGGATTPGDQKCAFITKSAAGDLVWSTEGVTRATAAQILAIGEDPKDGIWCATMHLSVFGAIFNLIAGCTNIELFTPEGFRAITENEGWYRSNAAGITAFILCLLGSVAIGADVVECWRFRYGKTHESWKHMKLCSNFLAWGPQLLKHRYAVFVVYARDLIACVTSGHSKLRNSSLLSSVQRFLAAQTHISVGCVSAHCWNGAGWLETPASLPHIVVSHKLRFHGHVAEDVIRNYLTGFSPYKVILRFVTTCWAVHPLVDSTRLGPGSVTVHKRTALQLAGIVGVVATNAMIFNFSGELRSWEADATCPISPSSLWFIAVATLVSVSVNAVPNAFLMDIAKQVHGRPGWIAFFWLLYAVYFSIGMAFLASLLANLNPKEQDKWYKSLEWSMSFKLFGMPMAQGLRHWIMLELFLIEDRKSKDSHFNTAMGFKHPEEIQVTDKGKEAAELMAKSAISLEELLTFAALLGDKVMPEYNPETTTSEEVLLNAIRPLCVEAPQGDHPLSVEVVELYGLDIPHSDNSEMKLSCSVYHLGHKIKGQRLCLLEEKSSDMTANGENSMMRYAWNFEAKLDGVKLEHAIGFAVHEGTRVLGIAWLPMEDLIKGQGHHGELRLQPLGSAGAPEKGKFFCEPSEASPVPAHDVLTGSNRLGAVSKLNISELTRLVVRVHVSDLCLKSLALHELSRVKELRPDHPSEMLDGNAADVRRSLVKLGLEIVNDERAKYASTAFCEPAVHFDSNDTNNNSNNKGGGKPYIAPKRIVVHSWKGLFSHLVAMVTADALAMEDGYNVVLELAQKFDYHTILDLLVEKGCQGARYWIDLFAIDPANFEMESNHDSPETPNPWHEGLLTALPTIFRDIRRNSCLQMATDLEEEQKKPSVPLVQLLIMDRKFHFLHESNCLAEMMLAKSMRFRQRLILHPKHLEGSSLGEELSQLASELGDAFRLNELPWTTPFLENKQAVYDTVKDLAVASVKETRKDEESTWQELSMTNLAATVVGYRTGQSSVFSRARDGGDAGGADDLGAMENGDVDVD